MAPLPIFCVARSSRTDLSMLVACALKICKIADGGMPPTYEAMHYYPPASFAPPPSTITPPIVKPRSPAAWPEP